MGSLEQSVSRALSACAFTPSDCATADLALTYARRVDEGEPLDKLGPQLLAALDALLMTPKARRAAMKGGESAGTVTASPLDQLRARREQRSA